jgi:Tripartite tricarboxylate transporter family receptor
LGTEAAVKAPPDGYALLLTGAAHTINATLYDKLTFNFIDDIVPIASIVHVPLVLTVHPSVPTKTVSEFITYAKANPGKINTASSSIGTTPHVSGELFRMMTGVNLSARALSRRGAGDYRPAWRTSAGHVCDHALFDRVHPSREDARARGNDGGAVSGAAKRGSDCRFHAGLRGERLPRDRRTKKIPRPKSLES